MTAPASLVSDRFIDFALFEILDAGSLCRLPAYADHTRETFEVILGSARKLSREVLAPAYRSMDAEPPRFVDGRVLVHPRMKQLLPLLLDLDLAKATRSVEVGGMGLPSTVATIASTYAAAANLGATGYLMLTAGAAHLIETFGSDEQKRTFMTRMMSGEWMGTMALTEPHAGSSLADVSTTATPQRDAGDGSHRIRGAKIFISGGDQDLTENIVHLVLARIEGAEPGTRGISLFIVPRLRLGDGGALVGNDVHTTGLLHKMGWRGLPSVALSFGDDNDCHGYLVGEAHQGLRYMFQMMNTARILVGLQGAATASAAYQEALAYARSRPQGRSLMSRDPRSPQVAIIEHADVRRMLLRQKSIVEGCLLLVGRTARYADLAAHSETTEERVRFGRLLDLLTPLAKTVPAERGFEANALAVQVHGGYGYTGEYPVEAYLRDQKLNTIHEGTSGIQGLDLLGRKVMAGGGAAFRDFSSEIAASIAAARSVSVEPAWCDALAAAVTRAGELTLRLGTIGLSGDVAGMVLHSADYLEMMGVIALSWMWIDAAAGARRGLAGDDKSDAAFYDGQLRAAQYWILTELPRATLLAALCDSGEGSYGSMPDEGF